MLQSPNFGEPKCCFWSQFRALSRVWHTSKQCAWYQKEAANYIIIHVINFGVILYKKDVWQKKLTSQTFSNLDRNSTSAWGQKCMLVFFFQSAAIKMGVKGTINHFLMSLHILFSFQNITFFTNLFQYSKP